MSAHKKSAAVRVPKGWRKLRAGQRIWPRDRAYGYATNKWYPTVMAGNKVCDCLSTATIYIRKTRSAKARKGKA